MLEVSGLDVAFDGTPAVVGADLEVPDGAVVAVVGPSGSGKSTLLRAVAGLEPPAAGTVAWDGADLARVPTHRRGFALMFQDGQLFAHLTVARNVAYPLRVRRARAGRARTDPGARVEELLALVGLDGYADRLPATLSGGERQRVALARALAADPRLLLLDEPLSALDAGLRERLAADLRRILVAAGTTTLLVTHDQDEAFAVADRLVVMRAGRIVQQGPTAAVWAAPADPATALFLGYANVLEGAAAHGVRRAMGGGGSGDSGAVALRRSALVVDPAGPLEATVRSLVATPDQHRLRVVVDGALAACGELNAVGPGTVGERVRLRVDPTRVASVGAALAPSDPPFRTGPI